MAKRQPGVETLYLFDGENAELRGRMAYNGILRLKSWWGDGNIEYDPGLLLVRVPGGPLVIQIRDLVTELGGKENGVTPEMQARLTTFLEETFLAETMWGEHKVEVNRECHPAYLVIRWPERQGELVVGRKTGFKDELDLIGDLHLYGCSLLRMPVDMDNWDDIVGFISLAKELYDAAVAVKRQYEDGIRDVQRRGGVLTT